MAGNDAYTVSLLHMDGASGATSFIDSATGGAHIWTQYGNAKITTDQFKWSAGGYFPSGATGNYIDTPSGPNFYFATGDFTIDLWMMTGTYQAATYGTPLGMGTDSDDANLAWTFQVTRRGATAGLYFVWWNGASTSSIVTGNVQDNIWHHIAAVRKNVSLILYLDGIASQCYNIATFPFYDSTKKLAIGKRGGSTGTNLTYAGYLDEIRISKGIARWNPTFSVPTSAYSPDSTALSLLHMDGVDGGTAFTDSNTVTGRIWTAYGDAKTVTAQSEFGGAALSLGGTGAYLATPGTTDFNPTGDITIDLWAKKMATGASYSRLCGQANSGGGSGQNILSFYSDYPYFSLFSSGATYFTALANTKILDTNWHHYAGVLSGTRVLLFVDGVLSAVHDLVTAIPWGWSGMAGGSTFCIGKAGVYAGQTFNGYIDEFRYSRGARWTASFPVPTAPYGYDLTGAYSDSVSLADSIGKSTKPIKSDILSLNESIFKNIKPLKTDILSLGDVFLKSPRPIFSDNISISETISKSPGKVESDTLSLSDSFIKSFGFHMSDAISLIDSLSKTVKLTKSDAITLLDFFSYILTLGGGQIFLKDLSDDIYLTDSSSRSARLEKIDAITIFDSLLKSIRLEKSDVIYLSDSLRKITYLNKSDIISLIDNLSSIIPRQVAEDLIYGFVHKKRTMQKGEQGGDFEFIHRGKTDTAIHEKSELEPGDFANAFDPNAFEVGGWTTVIPKDIKDFLFKPIKRVKKE